MIALEGGSAPVSPHGQRGAVGALIAVVAAHGGAGATGAAIALARGWGAEAWLIDADLAGGDAHARLGLETRAADAGLAARRGGGDDALGGGRRVEFGWLLEVCPRPELAWLIRDAAVRDAVRAAMRSASCVVVDAARSVGPALEPVVDADAVVLVAHATRSDALERTRRRLVRAGVEERRIIECATAPTLADRVAGRLRRSPALIDVVAADDRLLLLVEARLAAVGARDRT